MACRHGVSLREVCDLCVAQALRPPIKTRRKRLSFRLSDLRGMACLGGADDLDDEKTLFDV